MVSDMKVSDMFDALIVLNRPEDQNAMIERWLAEARHEGRLEGAGAMYQTVYGYKWTEVCRDPLSPAAVVAKLESERNDHEKRSTD